MSWVNVVPAKLNEKNSPIILAFSTFFSFLAKNWSEKLEIAATKLKKLKNQGIASYYLVKKMVQVSSLLCSGKLKNGPQKIQTNDQKKRFFDNALQKRFSFGPVPVPHIYG